uniref:Transcription initiation factor IIA subunit 2 n=1 Tax=Parascaris univalens TaxID=6257 RepID=A0A915B308_PARUN
MTMNYSKYVYLVPLIHFPSILRSLRSPSVVFFPGEFVGSTLLNRHGFFGKICSTFGNEVMYVAIQQYRAALSICIYFPYLPLRQTFYERAFESVENI